MSSQSSLPLEPAKAKAPGGAAALVVALGRSTAAMLVLSGIGFLILWQVVSMNVSPVILPEPVAVITAFIALTASGELVNATLATIWPFAIGLVLGFVVGTAVGLLLGIFRPAARVLDPYIFVGWSIPNIAWLPLFIAWFGVGNLTLIIFVFISAVFPSSSPSRPAPRMRTASSSRWRARSAAPSARSSTMSCCPPRSPTSSPGCASPSAARSSASSSASS